MDISFIQNIPYQVYHIGLKFTDNAKFTYFHGPKLSGILSSVLEIHPLGNIVVDAVESGHINYGKGDSYNFTITHFGNKDEFKQILEEKLVERFSFNNIENIPGFWFKVDVFKDVTEVYKEFYGTTSEFNLINLITPLRMSRSNPTRGKTFFDLDTFEVDRFFKLLYSRIYNIAKDTGIKIPAFKMPELPAANLKEKRLIWVDTIFNKIFAGIIGKVKFDCDLSNEWKEVLRFGLLTHAGNNTSLGFGKYALGKYYYESQPVKPARSFVDKMIEPENILQAFKAIKENKGQSGADGIEIDTYETSLLENLGIINREVLEGEYNPSALRGVLLPKSANKLRALAIPTVKDRVLQRGCTQVLNDTVEALFEDNSYAYRKGLSRRGAATTITKAYAEGYRFVLEADINAFFDNVNWEILYEKIDIIFRNDPVTGIIKKWITSDVVYNNQFIKREIGLPQGAAISPLLANLFLDELDDSLGNEFKLVRYADDFVVLCKSKDEVEKARKRVEEILDNLKLELKEEKTGIRDFEGGFKYLGYLFVRSLVTEQEKPENPFIDKPITNLENYKIPLNSWVEDVKVKKLSTIDLTNNKARITPLFSNEELKKYPVYLTSHEPSVFTSGDSLIIKYENADAETKKIPLKEINFVVVIGISKITLQSVLRLKEEGIPVYLCRKNGSLKQVFESNRNNYLIWLKQAELQNKESFVLNFTREIVSAKIHNSRVLALRYEWDESVVEEFKKLETSCKIYNSIDSIRGVEGRAAALFFENYAREIPVEWEFNGRKKNPPPDPVNAILSFGYSLLYNNISTALIMAGLNPAISWFHVQGNYNALASDIQEEFRHIIERLVIYLIKRKIITKKSFTYNKNSKYPYLLKNDARNEFIRQVENRLLTEFSDQGSKNILNYRTYFYNKAKQIAFICNNNEDGYESFRIK